MRTRGRTPTLLAALLAVPSASPPLAAAAAEQDPPSPPPPAAAPVEPGGRELDAEGLTAEARQLLARPRDERWAPYAARRELPPALVVEDAYRDVLRVWAAGYEEEGVGLLADLEERLASRSGCLEKVRGTTEARLAELAPEGLFPLALLFFAVYENHISHQRFAIAGDTLETVEERLDAYAATAGAAAAPVAGRGFAHLAYRLIRMGFVQLFERAVEPAGRAVEIDPESREGWRVLGLLEEKLSRYQDAVRSYQQLVALEPENRDARLRRAVNRARVASGDEETAAAEEALRELAEEAPEEWMRAVAYGELARLLEAIGETAEARAALAEGRRETPADESLAVRQVHQVLAADGHFAAADAAGIFLDAWDGDPGPSPRGIYDNGPEEAFERLLDRVEEDRRGRMGELARGLAALEQGLEVRKAFWQCRGAWRALQ